MKTNKPKTLQRKKRHHLKELRYEKLYQRNLKSKRTVFEKNEPPRHLKYKNNFFL